MTCPRAGEEAGPDFAVDVSVATFDSFFAPMTASDSEIRSRIERRLRIFMIRFRVSVCVSVTEDAKQEPGYRIQRPFILPVHTTA